MATLFRDVHSASFAGTTIPEVRRVRVEIGGRPVHHAADTDAWVRHVDLTDRVAAVELITADVEVILDARDDVLRIPSYALLQGGSVLVVEEGLLVEREVETGLRNWQWIEVVSGLAVGEAIVVSLDRKEVKAGAKSEITDETDRCRFAARCKYVRSICEEAEPELTVGVSNAHVARCFGTELDGWVAR